MPGIISGLDPVKMQPGGDAGQHFYNLQKTAPGTGANLRDFTDFLFDPTDPVDYFVLGLMAFPPAGIAAKLIQAGVKGRKLKKTLEKVKAAKGLTLGPTRESIKGKTGQLLVRQEVADLVPHQTGIESILGQDLGSIGYSDEMKDYIKENPDYQKEEGYKGVWDLVKDIGGMGKEFYEIAQSPEGREVIAEEVKVIPSAIAGAVTEADYSRYNPWQMLPDEYLPEHKADGGIMMLAKGTDIAGGGLTLGRAFLNKVKNNPKLQNKDGGPKKSTKEFKAEVARLKAAKQKEKNKKASETRRRKKELERQRNEAAAANRRKDLEEIKTEPVENVWVEQTGTDRLGRPIYKHGRIDQHGNRIEIDAAPIPSGAAAINRKIDDAIDGPSKQPKSSTGAKDPEIIQPGAGDPDKVGFLTKTGQFINPFHPYGRKYQIAGGVAAYLMSPWGPFVGSEDLKGGGGGGGADGPKDGSKYTLSDDPKGSPFGGGVPQKDNSLAYHMKQVLKNKGFAVDEKTDEFIDTIDPDTGDEKGKPKFFDYIKALPSGYMEKVADDPDFAKKAMAGFLNMMKPVEGYVPINPAVAFGEGYFGEETRQADMWPADVKTLKFLQDNPEFLAIYQRMQAAQLGMTLGDVKPGQPESVYETLLIDQIELAGYTADRYPDFTLTYNGKPVGAPFVGSLLGKGVDVYTHPGFGIQIRPVAGPKPPKINIPGPAPSPNP